VVWWKTCGLFFFAALFAGCAGTHAWEREELAKRKMLLTDDAEAALLEQHVYQYREGSAGGYQAGGGGCGCN